MYLKPRWSPICLLDSLAISMQGYLRLSAIIGLSLLSSMGCTQTKFIPIPGPTAVDNTLPFLELGTEGLQKNILMTHNAMASENRRAKSNEDVFFLATGSDPETGIRRVTLAGELRVVCIPSSGTTSITIVEPISESQKALMTESTIPVKLAKQYRLDVSAQRDRCRISQSRFHELRLELKAETENGVGQIRQLPAITISAFGPDKLKVGTFNLQRPAGAADDKYVSFGNTFGSKVDILLLTEVEDLRRAQLVASAAGMQHVVVLQDTDSDVAIASRTPLRNVERRSIIPSGRLGSRKSNILSAISDIGGYPHQLIVAHWGIRDDGDVSFPPNVSSPSRLAAAHTILSLLSPQPAIVIVGGDLNAYSGVGPQDVDNDASTADVVGGVEEIDILRSRLVDSFSNPGLTHCSNQRIDYVLIRGQYVPTAYESCFSNPYPSDHPYVQVTLEAQ